jgi:hypothetical protein
MLITVFDRLQDTPESMTLPDVRGKVVAETLLLLLNYEGQAKILQGQCVYYVLESKYFHIMNV